jgi:hypothetical protein
LREKSLRFQGTTTTWQKQAFLGAFTSGLNSRGFSKACGMRVTAMVGVDSGNDFKGLRRATVDTMGAIAAPWRYDVA